jgi:2-C-methyl-D-erythritol 4-phosphate cytidylyltransferase
MASALSVSVIIPAAGSSRRYFDSADAHGLKPVRAKIDEDLGGRPVLHRTVELFSQLPEVAQIIVAGPADAGAFAQFKDRHADKLGILGVVICQGGAVHRYETVLNALKLVQSSATHVAVHDAARPCASAALIERVFDAAREGHGAVVPGVDVPDTLKRVSTKPIERQGKDDLAAILGDAGARRSIGRAVEQTVDRSQLVGVQTPQCFEVGLLRRAYAQADLSSTDDAQLIERLGQPVLVVEGEATNIKITRAGDLALARMVLGFSAKGGSGDKPAHLRF